MTVEWVQGQPGQFSDVLSQSLKKTGYIAQRQSASLV